MQYGLISCNVRIEADDAISYQTDCHFAAVLAKNHWRAKKKLMELPFLTDCQAHMLGRFSTI